CFHGCHPHFPAMSPFPRSCCKTPAISGVYGRSWSIYKQILFFSQYQPRPVRQLLLVLLRKKRARSRFKNAFNLFLSFGPLQTVQFNCGCPALTTNSSFSTSTMTFCPLAMVPFNNSSERRSSICF